MRIKHCTVLILLSFTSSMLGEIWGRDLGVGDLGVVSPHTTKDLGVAHFRAEVNSKTFAATLRTAGRFQARGVVMIGGNRFVSNTVYFYVRFPDVYTLMNNATLQGYFTNIWTLTKNTATSAGRQEHGCFITLNTANGQYGITPSAAPYIEGNWTLNSVYGATINMGSRPQDNPQTPNAITPATYVVGWFHTHTPNEYVDRARQVGPSDNLDIPATITLQVPGIAYDYVEDKTATDMLGYPAIPAEHLKSKDAKLYPITTLERRAIP